MGKYVTHPRQARHKHRPYTHGLLLAIISLAVGYATITNGGFPGRSKAFAAPVTGLSLPGVSSSIPTNDQNVLASAPINKTLRAEKPVSAEQQEVAAQISAFAAPPTAVAASEDAVVRAAAVAPAPDLPPYQVYEVQDGDTVSSIGERFGIAPKYIIANNAEIQDSDFLVLGQSMIIPAGDGILHEVRFGETLTDIADRYEVNVDAIVGFRSNGIDAADDIAEAQLLFVPGGQPLPTTTAPEAAPVPDDAAPVEEPTPVPSDGSSGGDTSGGESGEVVSGPSSDAGLIWPFYGNISSYYGPSHPLGIDIDGFANPTGSIVAATSGTVIFAGGNACCSYGLYVVIMSPGGIETLYGHLSSIAVTQGETVSQGEVIGIIGSTGYSTGTHLHFEVIDNGVRVNPLSYLP
jgi:murein DD-endopeptidase MepM/ murein hydrolase activator NlpD